MQKLAAISLGVAVAFGAATGTGPAAAASGGGSAMKHPDWSFSGLFGGYDQAAAQRGYKVYDKVCASCHSMDHLHYRHLKDIGFSEAEVEALAADNKVKAGPNDQGEMYMRPAKPRDEFAQPYENDAKAKMANNGKVPPDLSVITKARAGGADYVYSYLLGYQEAPKGVNVRPGQYYNAAYGGVVAMPDMLSDGRVSYEASDVPETKEQYARDVTVFLQWASEPELEERKAMGIKVILFLVVLAGMLYALKRKIWANVDH